MVLANIVLGCRLFLLSLKTAVATILEMALWAWGLQARWTCLLMCDLVCWVLSQGGLPQMRVSTRGPAPHQFPSQLTSPWLQAGWPQQSDCSVEPAEATVGTAGVRGWACPVSLPGLPVSFQNPGEGLALQVSAYVKSFLCQWETLRSPFLICV